ncbi:class I SAM-dependent methyltransferase [Anaeromyxobacter diazotrophicus]|uniref:class I SAM-dependent methyltransferase n=1 Tax=Anaeromyxobacter diazotrophicus TaxID=2590199 RepID=UPI0015901D1A|nr:class I SAM-dependent methyltransferase [Anaeromyxobacter diazotrophicus]
MPRPNDAPAPRGGLPASWKALAIRHYHERAVRYEERVSRGLLASLRWREREAVLRLADLASPARRTVVDVGCGGGFFARAAKRAGMWVHAVDAAAGMVELVRPDVDLAEVADLETFDPPRRYDLVICCGALEFVASPGEAVARLCRLCAPGGRLVLQVPRESAGGRCYRLQKRFEGLRTVLYRRDALVAEVAAHGLAPAGEAFPLPYNMVVAFDAPGC